MNNPAAISAVTDNLAYFALDGGLLCWNTQDFKLHVNDGALYRVTMP